MTMGDYWVGPTIGEGGFAHVVYGVHKTTQRKVAIKVIDAHTTSSRRQQHQQQQQTAMIWNERHILSLPELNSSPWIVNLWGAFCDEQHPSSRCVYFVMELATGGDLEGLIQQSLSTSTSKSASSASNRHYYDSIPFYTSQLITAVDFLHSKGVLHCDLKPANILLDANTGCLKLTDFGCALDIKQLSSSSSSSPSSSTLLLFPRGTSQYSAPEILRAELPSTLTVALDYWSVGCIIHAMLHGRSPFTCDTDAMTVRSVFDYVAVHTTKSTPNNIIVAAEDDNDTFSNVSATIYEPRFMNDNNDDDNFNAIIPTEIDENDNNDNDIDNNNDNNNDKNLQKLSLGLLHIIPNDRIKFWTTSHEKEDIIPPTSSTKNVILPVPNWKDEVETTTLRDGSLGWSVFQL